MFFSKLSKNKKFQISLIFSLLTIITKNLYAHDFDLELNDIYYWQNIEYLHENLVFIRTEEIKNLFKEKTNIIIHSLNSYLSYYSNFLGVTQDSLYSEIRKDLKAILETETTLTFKQALDKLIGFKNPIVYYDELANRFGPLGLRIQGQYQDFVGVKYIKVSYTQFNGLVYDAGISGADIIAMYRKLGYTHDNYINQKKRRDLRRQKESTYETTMQDFERQGNLLVAQYELQKKQITFQVENFKATYQMKQQEAALRQREYSANTGAIAKAIRSVLADKKAISTTALGAGAISGFYFLSKYGIPKLLKSKPSTVIETSLPENWYEKFFGKKKPDSRLQEMVYNPDLQNTLNTLIVQNTQSIQDHEPLSNLLFYGPPGTGKTLAAREIARSSGAHYIAMSGSDLMQLSTQEALQELKQLFLFAQSSEKPVIIFIDEADSLFPQRISAKEINRKLTNMFLSLVEKPSHKKFQFIFSTNLPEMLDFAVLSRVSKSKIFYFDVPNLESRIKILSVYLKKLITHSHKKLTLSDELAPQLATLAESIEGWVGRDIEQLVLDVLNKVKLEKRSTVTSEDFFSVIQGIRTNEIIAKE